jgi:hypothetical protein
MRLHRVKASGAGGAGLLRGGTTLWLMSFLLSFATALSTGALVPKITKLRGSVSPEWVTFVLNVIKQASRDAVCAKCAKTRFPKHPGA